MPQNIFAKVFEKSWKRIIEHLHKKSTCPQNFSGNIQFIWYIILQGETFQELDHLPANKLDYILLSTYSPSERTKMMAKQRDYQHFENSFTNF